MPVLEKYVSMLWGSFTCVVEPNHTYNVPTEMARLLTVAEDLQVVTAPGALVLVQNNHVPHEVKAENPGVIYYKKGKETKRQTERESRTHHYNTK